MNIIEKIIEKNGWMPQPIDWVHPSYIGTPENGVHAIGGGGMSATGHARLVVRGGQLVRPFYRFSGGPLAASMQQALVRLEEGDIVAFFSRLRNTIQYYAGLYKNGTLVVPYREFQPNYDWIVSVIVGMRIYHNRDVSVFFENPIEVAFNLAASELDIAERYKDRGGVYREDYEFWNGIIRKFVVSGELQKQSFGRNIVSKN